MESTVISSDGEEEALSLRDFPLESQFQPKNEEKGVPQAIKTNEDFNFVCLANSLSTDQMCSADQLFFKGQILPLCVLSGRHQFQSVGIGNTSTNSITVSNANSKAFNFRNNKFNSDPSPRSKTRPVNVDGIRNQTVWGVFRFGLVRSPELDLKAGTKNRVRRNSKVVKNNKNGGQVSKDTLEKRRYSGCKCSVNVVETVPVVFIKSNKNNEKKKAILLEKKKLQLELKKMKEKEKGQDKARRRKASVSSSFNG